MTALCNACGASKPLDGFRACPTCRAEWRRAARKPGGPSETIERLTEALTLIERTYYMEGRTADWRAARMASIARDASDGKDMAPHLWLFSRKVNS